MAIVALTLCGGAWAQMQAMFDYGTFFRTSDNTPYVETRLLFDAWTMQFAEQPGGGYKAEAEVTLLLRQADSVCFVKKYTLSTPVVPSPDSVGFNILDVQRFAAQNGIYDLDISMRDLGTDSKPLVVNEKVVVAYDRNQPALSNLQLIASVKPTTRQGMISRGGYDLEPYIDDFIPESMSELNYYYEVYNIDREVGGDAFVAMAYVEERETGFRVETTQRASRKTPAATVPVLGSVDISELPSGNYNLVVELRNRDGQTMLFRRLPFFRSNPGVKPMGISDFATTFVGRYTDEAELNLYLDALYPIASEQERRSAREVAGHPGVEAKQAFLYNFWVSRDRLNAESKWLAYKERIDYVQEHFSFPMTRGIMTDRGRVYLQYGPPDYIRDEKNFAVMGHAQGNMYNAGSMTDIGNKIERTGDGSPNQAFYLPYQLWRYNQILGDDKNRVFLFWDQFRSGYYTLLNSNARGERQEYGWERRLSNNQVPEGVVGAVGAQFERGY